LAIQNLISEAKEVELLQTQLFWIPNSKTYQRSNFHPKTMSHEGDVIFQNDN
jgi:hypothetical protein